MNANANQTADVAHTILAQLGGNRFVAMTGAKHLLSSSDGLQFKLPARFAAKGINAVRVTLTPADTYTLTFVKVANRGLDWKTVSEVEGVCADQLHTVFTTETGLDTHL